jgi:gamma-glutamyltranspeptidase/glutathione hydrolase
MALDRLLEQPIAYARNGFPVSQIISQSWQASTELLSRSANSKRVWLPGGRAPRPGQVFRNVEFANTLGALAENGYETFYLGEIGQQIVDCVQSAGGFLTLDDLANYQAEWVEPISAAYRDGFKFHEIPPNGQGLTALQALNLVRGFELKGMDYNSPDRWHILIEAMKLAFADAATYIADPRQSDVPTSGLLSQDYAHERRELIDMDQARLPSHGRPPSNGDTVYLTVVDGEGNMVSWIQSLYMGFGSGLTPGTTGVQLHNRGANFSLVPGHPNELAPGKRPYHTIIPGFITRNGEAWSSFGVMGGFMQPQGHLQVGVNLIDFDMDPQSALDAPRFRWLEGNQVALEPGVSDRVVAELARRGHDLVAREYVPPQFFGGGQIIIRNPDNGGLIGGSDPRKDGAAVGW